MDKQGWLAGWLDGCCVILSAIQSLCFRDGEEEEE
jgi:hypothetical protein